VLARGASRTAQAQWHLAFTFHHSEDEPWVAVLESLFDAGYYLEATYPIRSDETKGEGEFGSKTIEYDIIHVCRKRTEEPKPVSWGRMRREVMADVRQLQAMLENHAKEGLPAADIQVIRRGKALEYFSRHYGKVYVDEGAPSPSDALVGINQLIDEDADKGKEPPPVNAEPITRQFLRTFGKRTELKRDQLQKFLKGSITTPDEFEQRGWCSEKNKVFTRTNPLDFAREWSGKHRRKLTSDLDQALVLIGACFDGSGINASDTLKNENFKPHVALKPLAGMAAPQRPGSSHPQRGLARGVDLQRMGTPARRSSRAGHRCSMTMGSMMSNCSIRCGSGAAPVGCGTKRPAIRCARPARSGACASSAGGGQLAGRPAEQWRQDAGGRGLEGSLDLLTPTDAEAWLGDAIKDAILSFQDEYEGDARWCSGCPAATTASSFIPPPMR
jgi:hypothetical protein